MTQPYLSGEHEPVDRERDDRNLHVRGELPRELCGMFVRNSPNPQFAPLGKYHWFDGDGMVHGVAFEGGRAHYRNRWIRTAGFDAERAAGEALWRGIKEPVDLTNPLGPVKDTANTHLIVHHGRLLATWWLSGKPMALSVPELETVGPDDFGGTLTTSMAAHPKVDPVTGELVFYAYDVFRRPYLTVGVASRDGRITRSEPIDLPRPHVPHDIALTERFWVILDLPLGWDRAAMAQGKRRIGFDRDVPSRFGLLPRAGGPVRWFEHDPCYVYHVISTYEVGNSVVITACRIADPIPAAQDETGTVARLDHIELSPVLYRWTLDLVTGSVTGEALDDVPTEFPRVDDRRWGTNNRYSYNPRIARRSELMFDGVLKYDLHRGGAVAHDWPTGWFGGEVVFAPRPGGTDEDDGWLITVLTSVDAPTSTCVVLDARDVAAPPLATVALPWRVPAGFHAEWVPLTASGA